MSIATLARSAAMRFLPRPMLHQLLWLRARRQARTLAREWPGGAPQPHELPAPLYVSLTSYPARFGSLHLTLRSLLRQSVKPDAILLWIAREDMRKLPRKVARLASKGITIRTCEDLGPYKKLVFALSENPDAFIVTADDDQFYPPRWLETLVDAVDHSKNVIICHRAHRAGMNGDDTLASYADWEPNVLDDAARRPSTDIVPIGCGGILYPPGSLDGQVLDKEMFQRLSPTADDLWFYWMARRAGSKVRKVGGPFPMLEWPSAVERSLWAVNRTGGNDRQIRNLEAQFGNPITASGDRA